MLMATSLNATLSTMLYFKVVILIVAVFFNLKTCDLADILGMYCNVCVIVDGSLTISQNITKSVCI